jgi:aminoglycoside 2'-N-acetyltransferase I
MVRIEIKPDRDFDCRERLALRALQEATYPPEVRAARPGRNITWASPEWSALVWIDGALASRVGLITCSAAHDGVDLMVGGVGGIMTHPERRGLGLATRALSEAVSHLVSKHGVIFSLLFCRDELVPLYARAGWRLFGGRVVVNQPHGPIEFRANRPMVIAGVGDGPQFGVIDLRGYPW